jgi:hyaluronan synthase
MSCLNSNISKERSVIVNYGSTNNTSRILTILAYKNPSLKVIHLKSIEKKQAIEKAVEISKGEIFQFMDSDCDIAADAL